MRESDFSFIVLHVSITFYIWVIILESLRRVQTITDKKVYFHEVDLLDKPALKAVFEQVQGLTYLN